MSSLEHPAVLVKQQLPNPIGTKRVDQWQQQIDLNISGLMSVIGAFTAALVEAIAFTVSLPKRVNLQQVTIMPTAQAT